MSGIVAAMILGVSRAIGETMVVAVAAGGSGGALFTANPFEPGQTITAAMASLATGTDQVVGSDAAFQSLFFLGFLLFVADLRPEPVRRLLRPPDQARVLRPAMTAVAPTVPRRDVMTAAGRLARTDLPRDPAARAPLLAARPAHAHRRSARTRAARPPGAWRQLPDLAHVGEPGQGRHHPGHHRDADDGASSWPSSRSRSGS